MHSYNNLWEKLIDPDNVAEAIREVIKSRGLDTKHEKFIKGDLEYYVDLVTNYMDTYKTPKHSERIIWDHSSQKERTIIVPTFEEAIVHHAMIQVMMPMLTKGMSECTYASIPDRGLHKCAKKIRHWIEHDQKHTKYFLQLDIKKFFENINREMLKDKLEKYIIDKKFLKLVKSVVFMDDKEKGLPLGFFSSHWLANWYLQKLDHYIKEDLKVKHYARYMDDMVIFGSNRKELEKIKDKIEEWLNDNDLELKSTWKLYRFDYKYKDKRQGHPLNFLGFKFYRNKTNLRKRLLKKMKRKANQIKKKGKCTVHDARQMMSYLGWVDWSNTYQVYKHYIAPIITFKKCKKIISEYDKKQADITKKIIKEKELKKLEKKNKKRRRDEYGELLFGGCFL